MNRNISLYRGEYYNVYNIQSYSNYYKEANDYLSVEVHKLITDFYTDLIHYETPIITLTHQEVFDEIATNVRLYALFYEVSKFSIILGEVFLQIFINREGKLNLLLHKEGVDIIPDPLNEQFPPLGFAINHIIDSKKDIRLVESHYTGKVTYEVVNTKGVKLPISTYENWKSLKYDEALSDEYKLQLNTGYKYNLVTHFKNEFNTELHGESDYTVSLEAKSKKLNEILNTTYSVIRKHSDPRAIIDKVTYDAIKNQINEKLNKYNSTNRDSTTGVTSLSDTDIHYIANQNAVSNAEVEMVLKQTMFMQSSPMSQNKAFEYVTWDGKLDEAYKMIDLLTNMIYEAVGLSKLVVSPDTNTANLSGVSYKRHVAPALRRAKKKQESFEASAKIMIRTIMSVLGYEDNVSIKFGDGLENDIHLVIEKNQKLIDYGLTTLKMAIQEVHNMDEAQADELFNTIAQEKLFTQPSL